MTCAKLLKQRRDQQLKLLPASLFVPTCSRRAGKNEWVRSQPPCLNVFFLENIFLLYILPAPSSAQCLGYEQCHPCLLNTRLKLLHVSVSIMRVNWEVSPSPKWVPKVSALSTGALAFWRQWINCVPFSRPFMSVSVWRRSWYDGEAGGERQSSSSPCPETTLSFKKFQK